MGAANVVPGVSGGTIAFITGIYEKLVESLQAFNGLAVKRFFKGQWQLLAKQVNAPFLGVLLLGIMLATFSLAQLMQYLLEYHTVALWAFFFGLILSSALVIVKHIPQWTWGNITTLVIGAGLAYYVTTITMVQTPNSMLYLFFAGAIAIATMILPGVSGSYVLVIMGKYSYVIGLVTGINEGVKNCLQACLNGNFAAIPSILSGITWGPLLIFTLGTIAGLISFAKLLHMLLKKFHALTITFLTGFMVGSLNKIWPWKKTLEWYTGPHGEKKPLEQVNILPPSYDSTFWVAVIVALVGFIVVYAIEWLGKYEQKPQS